MKKEEEKSKDQLFYETDKQFFFNCIILYIMIALVTMAVASVGIILFVTSGEIKWLFIFIGAGAIVGVTIGVFTDLFINHILETKLIRNKLFGIENKKIEKYFNINQEEK